MPKRVSGEKTGDDRLPMSVVLSPVANKFVNNWIDRSGGSKTKVVAKIIEWIAEAPESVQQFILVGPPRDRRDEFVRWVAEYFAKKVGIEPTTIPLPLKPKRAISLEDETGDDDSSRRKMGGK